MIYLLSLSGLSWESLKPRHAVHTSLILIPIWITYGMCLWHGTWETWLFISMCTWFISRFQLNSWTQFGLRSPDLRCHMFKHLCVRADHHQPSCFPFFLGLHVTLSWFLSEYCLIIRFHPNLDQGFFFFFSFVTPSCLYFVVVRNPSLTPAVYTIKLTFIYVALFFLTRLQGALERKKQTADEAAQIKRNK